ncbi:MULTISPECIES: alpha/beta fold hydrolase [Solirubrobacterales]|nr:MULTISPECIES: alpha/beta fold hydrolase [Solirubrobacterales]
MTMVLLHGFAGSRASWDAVRAAAGGEAYPALPLDLRGHGDRAHVRPVDVEACVADVLGALPDRPVGLSGYSLGGRVALHAAVAAPQRFSRLVLVATTAGIADEQERAARRAADDRLADALLAGGLDAFAARWSAQPLFADDPPAVRAAQEAEVRAGDPQALAAVLRGLSPGRVPALWDRLGALDLPVDVVVGGRDAKYRALGERLAAALPQARLHVLDGAGHGLLREAPAAVAAVLRGG